jgi:hypothetical protein
VYTEKNKKTKELEDKQRFWGESVVSLKDLITQSVHGELGYTLYEEGKMSKSAARGTLVIGRCQVRKFYSFIELHVKNGLNIVPIVAIDYSLANLTFEENNLCLHSLKPGGPNDYIQVLKSVAKAFQMFAKFNLAYAVGARTLPKDGPSSDLESLTGDLLKPFIGNKDADDIIEFYAHTLRNVRLALPINFKPITKLVCDFA